MYGLLKLQSQLREEKEEEEERTAAAAVHSVYMFNTLSLLLKLGWPRGVS